VTVFSAAIGFGSVLKELAGFMLLSAPIASAGYFNGLPVQFGAGEWIA
jgi:hypothetical protein